MNYSPTEFSNDVDLLWKIRTDLAPFAVHDVFIKILGKINAFDDNITFEAWFNRMVFKHCMNAFQKEKTFQEIDNNDYSEYLTVVIEESKSNEIVTKKLKEQVDKLNDVHRTITSILLGKFYFKTDIRNPWSRIISWKQSTLCYHSSFTDGV